jgi:hypothetical protein
LRRNPGLAEALSTRHPLLGYYVNENWAETRMASIHVIRDADTGQVFGGFLVDLAWLGMKDAYGSYAEPDVLGELQRRARPGAPALVPIDPELGVTIIRGGVAWAERLDYALPEDLHLWLRVVDPIPPHGISTALFGDGQGHPVIIGTPAELEAAGFDLDELEVLDERDDEEEPDPVPMPPRRRRSNLWLPGGPPPDPDDPPDDLPRAPSGLWLPGR